MGGQIRLPLATRYSPFAARRLPFTIRHSLFAVVLPFAIR